jgi:hypothetical protein
VTDKAKITITVLTDELAAVVKWTSPDDTLRHLRLVAFRNNEYVAVDGHRMVRVPCETHGLKFGLEREHILAAVAAAKVGRPSRTLILEPKPDLKLVEVGIGAGEDRKALSTPVRLTLPLRDLDYMGFPSSEMIEKAGRSIDPAEPVAATITGHIFDPKYMAAIEEVHRVDARSADNMGIEIVSFSRDKVGPTVFRNGKGIQFVVMPIKPAPGVGA